MDIIVFGSAIIDMICYAPRLPKAGETLHGDKFATGFGGKGANQCIAAARLGAKCTLVAKLGNDTWGEKYLNNLKKHEINVDYIKMVEDNTGIAQITVANSGENHIIIVPGANNSLLAEDFNRAIKDLSDVKVLLCQQETPINATIEAIKHFKGISILNCAPALDHTPKELIQCPTFLCLNETEASLMTQLSVQNLEEGKLAVLKLLEMGANSIILTMGKDGAIYSNKRDKTVFHIPTVKIDKVIDTTGAGDAFIGSFAFFQAKYPNIPTTQHIGAACEIASLSVKKLGTQSSFHSISEIEEAGVDILKKHYNITVL